MKRLFSIFAVTLVLVLAYFNFASILLPRTSAQQQFTITISSVEILEGDSGSVDAVFTVTITPAAFFNVSVGYATSDNTAIAGSDYTPQSGRISFPTGDGGSAIQTIRIPVLGDLLAEPPETFFVVLQSPSPAEYVGIGTPGAGICTIISNDTAAPSVSLFGVSVDEGDGPNTDATFRVSLNQTVTSDVTLDYNLESLSAVVGQDFFRTQGPATVTIRRGLLSTEFSIPVIGDSIAEWTERFRVTLSNVRGGGVTIGNGEALGEIRDDDIPTTVTVCSNDTPKQSQPLDFAARAESIVRVNQDFAIGDLKVSLHVSNQTSQVFGNIRVNAGLAQDSGMGQGSERELFRGVRMTPGNGLGSTCTPTPNFVIDDNSARRLQDHQGEVPYIGEWLDAENGGLLFEGLRSRGNWHLGVKAWPDNAGFGVHNASYRIECFCLTLSAPREGLKLEPASATLPVFDGIIQDSSDQDSDGDSTEVKIKGGHTIEASLNLNGAPAQNIPITFTVRERSGQGAVLDTVVKSTNFRGRAYYSYYDWVPGEHRIEARAEVNGAIYTDIANVTWINPCAATAALQGKPEAQSKLDAMRVFRDSKLAKSERGREYARLYYRFSPEAARLVMFNPMLLLRSQEMIERYTPLINDITQGKAGVLTEGDLNEIGTYLDALAGNASPELGTAIKNLREDLNSPHVHQELGIRIMPGQRRNLSSRPSIQGISGSVVLLGGLAGLVLYGLGTRRRRVLFRRIRRNAIPTITIVVLTIPMTPLEQIESPKNSFQTAQPLMEPAVPVAGTHSRFNRSLAFEEFLDSEFEMKFLARGDQYDFRIGPAQSVFRLRDAQGESSFLRMELVDANREAPMSGLKQLPVTINYLVGSGEADWTTNVRSYEKVRARNVYDGIDVLYYTKENELEYDLIVAPGADPAQVKLRFDGMLAASVDESGDLVMATGKGLLRHRKPVAYQEKNGDRNHVESSYVIEQEENNESILISLHLGEYDRSIPLVIDPVLHYSSYLGGSGADQGTAIAVDAEGNAYVTGITDSVDLALANPSQPGSGGDQDAFVAKLDSAGTLIYLTYLGGNQLDNATSIALDGAGNAYIGGFTRSTNFPTLNAIQSSNRGGFNAFITKLGPTGAPIYSTYFGGSRNESVSGIAVDSAGNAYIAGIATSANLPTSSPLQPSLSGTSDVFVSKLNSAGDQLAFSTYLGGSQDDAATSIAIDPAGNVYVTGATLSGNFTTSNAVQAAHGGGIFDGFVLKLNAAGNQIIYSTFLGGAGSDRGMRIAADAMGAAYVTGDTHSTNFPLSGALQGTAAGSSDAFLTKLNPNGTLAYSTYVGGDGIDGGTGIAVDSSGGALVTGFTGSTNFPLVEPVQINLSGGSFDAFVARVNPSGSALAFSSYLGGEDVDTGFGIAQGPSNRIYITGVTGSVNFPIAAPFQTANRGGSSDVFVTSIRPGPGIAGVLIQGKHLIVNGGGFVAGATILLNGQPQNKTAFLSTTTLRGKKVARNITSGQMVLVQVRNPDGVVSNEFRFTRP